jgi:hypothetical protein
LVGHPHTIVHHAKFVQFGTDNFATVAGTVTGVGGCCGDAVITHSRITVAVVGRSTVTITLQPVLGVTVGTVYGGTVVAHGTIDLTSNKAVGTIYVTTVAGRSAVAIGTVVAISAVAVGTVAIRVSIIVGLAMKRIQVRAGRTLSRLYKLIQKSQAG